MLLYGVPLSPFVRKTLFMLYEMDCVFEQRMTVPQDDAPDFRRVSPLGRIPGLADGKFTVTDSSAICHYLARRHWQGAGAHLIDYDDPQTLARIIGWDKYADEDLAPAAFMPLFERVIKPVRLAEAPDETRVQSALDEQLPPVFDHLDVQLGTHRGPWLLGDRFSYADIAVGAHMSSLWLASVGVDYDRWSTLSAWFECLQGRPAFNRLCDEARNFQMP